MAEQDAFRQAGRAARVEDRGGVAGVDRDVGRRLRVAEERRKWRRSLRLPRARTPRSRWEPPLGERPRGTAASSATCSRRCRRADGLARARCRPGWPSRSARRPRPRHGRRSRTRARSARRGRTCRPRPNPCAASPAAKADTERSHCGVAQHAPGATIDRESRPVTQLLGATEREARQVDLGNGRPASVGQDGGH